MGFVNDEFWPIPEVFWKVPLATGPAEWAVPSYPLYFWRMVVIFSRRILFSLSISVYRSDSTVMIYWKLTFEHLIPLLIFDQVLEFLRLPCVNTWFNLLQILLVDRMLSILPFASKKLVRSGDCSVHFIIYLIQ